MSFQQWHDYVDETQACVTHSRALLFAAERVTVALIAAGVRVDKAQPEIGRMEKPRYLYALWHFERGDEMFRLVLDCNRPPNMLNWSTDNGYGFVSVNEAFALTGEMTDAMKKVTL